MTEDFGQHKAVGLAEVLGLQGLVQILAARLQATGVLRISAMDSPAMMALTMARPA